jgi:hypothetical protein
MKLPILLVGAAERTLRDIEDFEVLCYHYDIMAIGIDAINNCMLPIKYVATYHYEDIKAIKELLQQRGFHTYKIIHHKDIENDIPLTDVDIVEPHIAPSGSSALLGTMAAIHLGYTKIIISGCPLIGQDKTKAKFSYTTFQKGWEHRKPELKDYVRSMSGFTKELLGLPTLDWLNN